MNLGHVLGELELVTVSESDGGVHELLHAFLPGSSQHEGVLDVEVAESVTVVVSKTSELVLEVENPSDSGLDVSVLDPPLVGDVGGSVVVEVSAADFEVSHHEGLGSLSEGFTSVMEHEVVLSRAVSVLPGVLHSNVELVAIIFPGKTTSFVLDGIGINLSGGSAVSMVHVHSEDILLLVTIEVLSFPDDVSFAVVTLVLNLNVVCALREGVGFGVRGVPVEGDSVSVFLEDIFTLLEVHSGEPNHFN